MTVASPPAPPSMAKPPAAQKPPRPPKPRPEPSILGRLTFGTFGARQQDGAVGAADIGAAGGGRVGREVEAEGLELGVELVAHQAGLHPGPLLAFVHFQQLVHVFGEIQYEGMPHGLTGQAGAAAAWKQCHLVVAGNTNGLQDIFRISRKHDRHGPDLVNAGVGSVKAETGIVAEDISSDV